MCPGTLGRQHAVGLRFLAPVTTAEFVCGYTSVCEGNGPVGGCSVLFYDTGLRVREKNREGG